MLELEELQKMGLAGWPLVGAIAVVGLTVALWWHGWPEFITHHHYHNDEETED